MKLPIIQNWSHLVDFIKRNHDSSILIPLSERVRLTNAGWNKAMRQAWREMGLVES